MEAQTLQAEVREKSGKGPARQLRMRGLIPSIYYGPGIDPVKLTVSPESLTKILTGPYRRNQVIALEINGDKKLALVKDLEIDSVSRDILHADFYSIAEDREVATTVPFETSGRAHGVHMGGTLRKYFRDLPVRAFPQNVPATIKVDVASLEIGDELKVKDLAPGDGVRVTYAPERRVVYIDFKEKIVEEEEKPAVAAAAPAADTPEA